MFELDLDQHPAEANGHAMRQVIDLDHRFMPILQNYGRHFAVDEQTYAVGVECAVLVTKMLVVSRFRSPSYTMPRAGLQRTGASAFTTPSW
jgi:hypothetical protein